MFRYVKSVLGVTEEQFDQEILMLIDGALADMTASGIKVPEKSMRVTNRTSGSVSIDKAVYVAKLPMEGEQSFSYSATAQSWKLDGYPVELSEYGITFVGTPADMDRLVIRLETPIGDALISTAIVTYARMKFGSPDDYDRLKSSYDEQKAQLRMNTGHTDWGGDA